MIGDEDLGLDMVVGGTNVHVAQKSNSTSRKPADENEVKQDFHNLAKSIVKIKNNMAGLEGTLKLFATGMIGNEDLGLDMVVGGTNVHIAQYSNSTILGNSTLL